LERPTKEQIKALPVFTGVALDKIKVIQDQHSAREAVKVLSHYSVLGFDTESKPAFKKGEVSQGPHLIQLACESATYLFPTRFKSAIAELDAVLSNDKIRKVGFGLSGDKKLLRRKFGIELANLEDLAVKLKRIAGLKQTIGARAAVAMIYQQRLTKKAQTSDWSRLPLSEAQLKYAANDAYSALCIELELEARSLVLDNA